MGYERFIARRFTGSKHQLPFIRIISIVSIAGITVGVAALVIVLSVFNGFNGVVTKVLIGFDPHIRIEPARGKVMSFDRTLADELESELDVAGWAPYVEGKALLMTQQSSKVVFLRGVVDSTIDMVSGVKEKIVLGDFALHPREGTEGIVLGLTLADRLGAVVGREVTVISPAGIDAMLLQFGHPITRRFTLVGVYDSRNKDYDANYAFIDIGSASALFQSGDGISGIEMRLHDIQDAERVQASLRSRFNSSMTVSTWYDLHKDLYSVMLIERWSAYIILCLIIGVASFNVLGSLVMSVIEKRREIGILKSLGTPNGGIIQIFMFEGVQVGLIGTVLGMIIGLVVCYLQVRFHLFPLDPRVYIISAIPVELRLSDFIWVGGASMVLSSLAALYPAMRAARLNPVDAIRWE